jgi:syntaxin 16
VGELTAAHRKRLKVDFETDEVQQEREIDAKTREITEIFHHAENLLKRFGKQTEAPGLKAEERTVRKNMQMSMAKKLQGLSMSFRSTQKTYLTQLQAQKSGGGAPSLDFLSETKKPASTSEFVDQGFVGIQMTVLEDIEEIVNQRDEEITRIAKSIEELAQIFRELAVLVIDQGTILDRIDYNMENAVEHVQEGMKQLVTAEQHQKNAMTTKCILALIVLIVIMMSVLIWKHSK